MFDIFPLCSISHCLRYDRLCFLFGIINFIKSMNNIQYVRLVTNKHNIDSLRLESMENFIRCLSSIEENYNRNITKYCFI